MEKVKATYSVISQKSFKKKKHSKSYCSPVKLLLRWSSMKESESFKAFKAKTPWFDLDGSYIIQTHRLIFSCSHKFCSSQPHAKRNVHRKQKEISYTCHHSMCILQGKTFFDIYHEQINMRLCTKNKKKLNSYVTN